MQYIYLTVDDGPSSAANDCLDYLVAKKVGAIMFCRGDYLQKRSSTAVRAIRDGYIIGNHSYDHPHFSTLSEEQARTQIARTDETINRLYAEAEVKRPAKYFRFPYTDAGAESNQLLLQEYGYWFPFQSPRRDWIGYVVIGDWGVDESNVEQKLELAKQELRRQLHPEVVLDLHDHVNNCELRLFQRICDFIPELGVSFYSNKQLQEHAHRKWSPFANLANSSSVI